MAQFVVRCRRSVERLSAEGKKSHNGRYLHPCRSVTASREPMWFNDIARLVSNLERRGFQY